MQDHSFQDRLSPQIAKSWITSRSGATLLPVSRFGFIDDGYFEKLEWHDPAEGLRTMRTLKEAITPSDSAWPRGGKETLMSELGKLELALENALAQAVPFCLLLRLNEGMSGPKADSREGTF